MCRQRLNESFYLKRHELLAILCVLVFATVSIGQTPSQYYVDPSAGTDDLPGGTLGDPWQSIQYALNNISQDTTDGDQINVKSGGTDTLTSALSTTTYGTPATGYPLIIRGYTSSANDGGVGVVSGGGTYSIWNDSDDQAVAFVDMRLTNSGSADLIATSDRFCAWIRCEFDNTTGDAITINDLGCVVSYCHFHDIDGYGIYQAAGSAAFVSDCVFEHDTAKDMTAAIRLRCGSVTRNVIDIDGAAIGIQMTSDGGLINGNSIFSSAGTGSGILLSCSGVVTSNNLIEGFSGVGGVGISLSGDNRVAVVQANSIENCTTEYSTDLTQSGWFAAAPESLSASPFTNAGSDDFTPVDTGSVKEGAWPQTVAEFGSSNKIWRGAIEPAAGSGGPTAYGILSIETGIAR